MTDYEWLTEMGLCHKCRREKAAPGRKYCFNCLEKYKDYRRKNYNPEKEKKYNERKAEKRREKVKNGICSICSEKATHGIYCYEHYIYTKRQGMMRNEKIKRKRRERGLIPEYRKENGLCVRCGGKLLEKDKVENYKMCFFCREKQSEILKKARKNSPWGKSGDSITGKRRKRNEHIHTDLQEAEKGKRIE